MIWATDADHRDESSDKWDELAILRDRAGDERDRAAEAREQLAVEQEDVAGDNFRALASRVDASRDRHAANEDRKRSTLDRARASNDRAASARERARGSLDGLTGAYLRDAGIDRLHRGMLRLLGLQIPMVVAFVDVDLLKELNDSSGHAAGDLLLANVAGTLKSSLRPGDLVIRYGGDEFICAAAGLTSDLMRRRLDVVNEALGSALVSGSISYGIAEASSGDTMETIIGRADLDMYTNRRHRGVGR